MRSTGLTPIIASAVAVLVSAACLVICVRSYSGTPDAKDDVKAAVNTPASDDQKPKSRIPVGTIDLNFVAPDGSIANIAKQPLSVDCAVVMPAPPSPNPPPQPSPPGPSPAPAPIPAPGLHVLIVTAKANITGTPEQSVLQSKELNDYLNSHCTSDPGSNYKGWRAFGADVMSAELLNTYSAMWRNAYALRTQPYPCIIVSNGTTGYVGPMPVNINDLMTLLKKYGGD
jgi:hypothetical protein